MKNILSLIMIVSFMVISFSQMKTDLKEHRNKRLYSQRINKLKKATVKIVQYYNQDRNYSSGSGSLIHIKETGQSWVMTNAHVCVYDFTNYIKSETHRKQIFPKRELKLNLQGKNGFIFIKAKGSDLSLDHEKDICLIPVNKKDFPTNVFSFIDSTSRPEVVAFAKNKENNLMMFTLNHAKKNEVLIKKGFFKNFEEPLSFLLDKTFSYTRAEGALSTIDIIPGDSGSVIVNKNLDIVGVAYGSQMNLTFFEQSGDMNKDLELCLKRNKLNNKRSLAFVSKDIKEIDGAFYPIAFLKK